MYIFFWVFPRRQIVVGRRFGHTLHPAFEDGTDTGFRNVGQLQFDAGEIPKRKYTIFKSRRKSKIRNLKEIEGVGFIWLAMEKSGGLL